MPLADQAIRRVQQALEAYAAWQSDPLISSDMSMLIS